MNRHVTLPDVVVILRVYRVFNFFRSSRVIFPVAFLSDDFRDFNHYKQMPIERNRGNKQLIGGLAEASRENPVAVIRIGNDTVFRSGKKKIDPTF